MTTIVDASVASAPGDPSPPSASLRRGACPSLAAPMQTGDGLLVRLRPVRLGLKPSDYVAIARLAEAHGNGLIEVTARGNLQVRGLRNDTVPALSAGLAEAGIDHHRGVAVEVPPLSGLEPDERTNAAPLAAAIRIAIARHMPPLRLAPKLSIVVDGGGRLGLGDMIGDIRLDAQRHEGRLSWRLSVGGDGRSARQVALVADGDAVEAVMIVTRALDEGGIAARGRTLDAGALRQQLGQLSAGHEARVDAVSQLCSPIGLHATASGTVLGLGLAYGATRSASLARLMQGLDGLGAKEIRLAQHRALLVLGLADDALDTAVALARREGFWTRADEPGNAISVCAGAAGCASGRFDTKAAADALVAMAPALLDGSAAFHISGCAKGCAHPRAAGFTLCGRPDGVGLVIGGSAGDEAIATFGPDGINTVFAQFAAFVAAQRQKGETVRQVLERVERPAIAAIVEQGRT